MMMTEPSNYEASIEEAHAMSNDSPELILEALGFNMGRGGQIKCACPVHGGDNRYGFSWHPQKKVWKCWTNHCHEKYGSNLLGLIRGIQQCTMDQAIDFVHSVIGKNFDLGDVQRKNFVKTALSVDKEHEVLDKSKLEKMTRDISYFTGRGLSPEIVQRYYCFNCKTQGHPLNNRACVPIFTENEDLIGFSGRILDDKLIDKIYCPKWKLYPNNIPREKTLFNLNKAKEDIKRTKTAVVVEGQLDVMKFVELGITNTIAPLGTFLSTDHIKLLIKNGCQNLVLCLDPDKAGESAEILLRQKLKMYFNLFSIDLKKDPGEYTIDEANRELRPILEEICQ